jgi:inhibitor of KinA sporulation pathway (predicted exonuclease)
MLPAFELLIPDFTLSRVMEEGYDRRQFERQCQSRYVSYPFGSRHINVKSLLAIIHALPQEVGMAKALELLNLPLEGTHHRGGDDAWNIAGILSELLLQTRAKK